MKTRIKKTITKNKAGSEYTAYTLEKKIFLFWKKILTSETVFGDINHINWIAVYGSFEDAENGLNRFHKRQKETTKKVKFLKAA